MRESVVRVGATALLAVVVTAALSSCGNDDAGGRAATAVSASTSGVVVTDTTTDLGSIIIGWGEQHSDTEITTPRAEDVNARCFGGDDDLRVDIAAPHGWNIQATMPSQILTVENTEQDFSGEIDTTNRFLETLRSVDWSQPGQVDLAVTADAPADWNSPYGTGRIYLSIHIDCR